MAIIVLTVPCNKRTRIVPSQAQHRSSLGRSGAEMLPKIAHNEGDSGAEPLKWFFCKKGQSKTLIRSQFSHEIKPFKYEATYNSPFYVYWKYVKALIIA